MRLFTRLKLLLRSGRISTRIFFVAILILIAVKIAIDKNTGPEFMRFRLPSVQLTTRSAWKAEKAITVGHQLKRNQSVTSSLEVIAKATEVKLQDIDSSKGILRSEFLRQKCKLLKSSVNTATVRVSIDDQYRLVFCPMCKVASTFWTRFFKMLQKNLTAGLTPYDIPISEAPPTNSKIMLKASENYRSPKFDSYFKFLFVRDPFSLVFSAFVDKIVGPNPYFWKSFGVNAISLFRDSMPMARLSGSKCGSDVRFEEYVKFIVHSYRTKRLLDCHVNKYEICHPCEMNYTYIGKIETFEDDTFAIFSHLKLNASLEAFRKHFTDFHADDAIEDSVSGPFNWKADIVKCMSWHDALNRIWTKLQIRGIIGRSPFPLNDSQSETISKYQFLELLKDVRRQTTASERRQQTKEAFIEAFKRVPLETLAQVRNVYKEEFLLFDYNDTPDSIFERNYSSESEGKYWFS